MTTTTDFPALRIPTRAGPVLSPLPLVALVPCLTLPGGSAGWRS